jgi:hypothetical protein
LEELTDERKARLGAGIESRPETQKCSAQIVPRFDVLIGSPNVTGCLELGERQEMRRSS